MSEIDSNSIETKGFNEEYIKNIFKKYKYEILFLIIISSVLINRLLNHKTQIMNSIIPIKGMNPKIPRVIYQCYKDKNIPPIVKERWLKLNPDFKYYLYDNDDCYKFLLENYNQKFANIFKFIKDGPIKSDFWRLCVLYLYGGVYADIDIVPLIPIDDFVNSDTTLYTCISDHRLHLRLNPHFIAVEPENSIIKSCIQMYINKIIYIPYNYWKYSITKVMTNVLQELFNIYKFKEDIYKKDGQIVQLSQEICNNSMYDCFISQNNIKIMENRDKDLYDAENHKFKISKKIII